MSLNPSPSESSVYDTTIRMLFLLLIIAWCLMIMYPFLTIMLWSLVLALAFHPLHTKMAKKLGGKKTIASVLLVGAVLLLIILPIWLLIGSLVDEVKVAKASYDAGTLTMPLPTEKVREWPVIGEKLYTVWQSATDDIEKYISKYKDQLFDIGKKITMGIIGAAGGLIQIMMSLVIAGILLAMGGSGKSMRKFFSKVAGERGYEFADLAVKTVNSVVKGIIGEALILAVMNGLLFLFAGVPYAGVWTLLVFVFAVLQIPVFFITIPVMVYFFVVMETLPAVLWTVALLLVSMSDNILTPMMLGKGAPVPMPVIFIGVVGGSVLWGFIGLFTGPIVLAMGYTLFMGWINADQVEETK